ncbi:hypothetical protein [Pseudovibrio sp. W64]|uniref:hypothetical protein n=1 Tax=Pseudovibrio sp. W64 TaxID=1735583 RepID=UPI0007AE9F6D|nr:hypothetical protein [Pseudovibrio sp. W64]
MPKFNWKHFLAFAALGIASSLVAAFYTASVVSYWAGGVPVGAVAIQAEQEHWLRAWVGATSGWAAAVAAVVTIIVLRNQSKLAEKAYLAQSKRDIRYQLAKLTKHIHTIESVKAIAPQTFYSLKTSSNKVDDEEYETRLEYAIWNFVMIFDEIENCKDTQFDVFDSLTDEVVKPHSIAMSIVGALLFAYKLEHNGSPKNYYIGQDKTLRNRDFFIRNIENCEDILQSKLDKGGGHSFEEVLSAYLGLLKSQKTQLEDIIKSRS